MMLIFNYLQFLYQQQCWLSEYMATLLYHTLLYIGNSRMGALTHFLALPYKTQQ